MYGLHLRSKEFRKWSLILYWIAIFTLTHWPGIERFKPRGLFWSMDGLDKVFHAGFYFGWAMLWWWLLSVDGRTIGRAAVGWVVVGGMAYGMFDEVSQAIVERTPDVFDFLCDVGGLAAAVILLQVWRRRRVTLDLRQGTERRIPAVQVADRSRVD